PIIGAAAALKLPELLSGGNAHAIGVALAGAAFAAAAAWLSATFLQKYFRTKTLIPFAWYCLLAGLLSLLILAQ
ncbi:MAG: undecaprenyl-diphosphate phosphatase, partial [Candidatus Saccharimonadales bacterium]